MGTMTSTALALAPTAEIWEAADWKKLWRSICNKSASWRTLAVVPAGPSLTPELSLQFAAALAYAGSLHLDEVIDVANGTRVAPSQIAAFSQDIDAYLQSRDRLVVALSAFSENEASLPLARAAGASLLCVLLGEVRGPAARNTISQLGASHFVGSAALRLPASVLTWESRPGVGPLRPRNW
jgi:hypothetical protein